MSFTLYPAIDLKDGQCVRLVKGDMLSATVFSLKPGKQTARVVAAAEGVPVIASGGLAGLGDVEACMATPGITGVICGRALYDGKLSPREALALARGR